MNDSASMELAPREAGKQAFCNPINPVVLVHTS
jgi:hypothetical protein